MLIDLTSAERAAISFLEFSAAVCLRSRSPKITVIVRPRTGDDTPGVVVNMQLTIVGNWWPKPSIFRRTYVRRRPTAYPDRDVWGCWD